ncbi:MAG: hypothetical protein AB7N65_02340 [Vicinamibacterales bacterium]
MTRNTRNFIVVSLLALSGGIATGLVAYFGLPAPAVGASGAPDELRFIPDSATLVAFADVQQVMTSEFRHKLRSEVPVAGHGQSGLQAETGINIETDIDRVVFGAVEDAGSRVSTGTGLLLARGRFDAVRVEAALRGKGATPEPYKGTTVFVSGQRDDTALGFLEPGLVAFGPAPLVRRAIDLRAGGRSILTNDALMSRVRQLEPGHVWAVGRFDALTSHANLNAGPIGQLPGITWFSASALVDAGLRAAVQAEARDEAAATGLRDLIRGFVALARMQTSARPELGSVLQSLQLGGVGETVTLSFDLTPSALDGLAQSMRQLPTPARPSR